MPLFRHRIFLFGAFSHRVGLGVSPSSFRANPVGPLEAVAGRLVATLTSSIDLNRDALLAFWRGDRGRGSGVVQEAGGHKCQS